MTCTRNSLANHTKRGGIVMKMIRVTVMLLVMMALALSMSAIGAGAPTGKSGEQAVQPGKGDFLADMHEDKGIDCSSCHGEKMKVDDNETVVNVKCIECHGTLSEM